MQDVLIVPTYGFVTKEDTPGGRGTKARLAVAQTLIREGVIPRECLIYFPQNMLPKGRELEFLGRVTLGKNIADYVLTLPEFSEAAVIDEDIPANGTSGTFDDTIACLKEAYRDLDGGRTPRPLRIYFVSDWSQLGRVWLIWHLTWGPRMARRGWKASFHFVPNFRSMRDIWFHEPPAYVKCLINCLKWRFSIVWRNTH